MMNNMMEYKGYHTKIEFDAESMTLRGKIEGINIMLTLKLEIFLALKLSFILQ